jgi:hypothetical protein
MWLFLAQFKEGQKGRFQFPVHLVLQRLASSLQLFRFGPQHFGRLADGALSHEKADNSSRIG